jgi:hypothetical protein
VHNETKQQKMALISAGIAAAIAAAAEGAAATAGAVELATLATAVGEGIGAAAAVGEGIGAAAAVGEGIGAAAALGEGIGAAAAAGEGVGAIAAAGEGLGAVAAAGEELGAVAAAGEELSAAAAAGEEIGIASEELSAGRMATAKAIGKKVLKKVAVGGAVAALGAGVQSTVGNKNKNSSYNTGQQQTNNAGTQEIFTNTYNEHQNVYNYNTDMNQFKEWYQNTMQQVQSQQHDVHMYDPHHPVHNMNYTNFAHGGNADDPEFNAVNYIPEPDMVDNMGQFRAMQWSFKGGENQEALTITARENFMKSRSKIGQFA